MIYKLTESQKAQLRCTLIGVLDSWLETIDADAVGDHPIIADELTGIMADSCMGILAAVYATANGEDK